MTDQTINPENEPTLYRASVDRFADAAQQCATVDDLSELLTAYGAIATGLTQALTEATIKALFPGEQFLYQVHLHTRLTDALVDPAYAACPGNAIALIQNVLQTGASSAAPAFVAADLLRGRERPAADSRAATA